MCFGMDKKVLFLLAKEVSRKIIDKEVAENRISTNNIIRKD